MLCKKCNAQIEDNAKFCNSCGTAVDQEPIVATSMEFPHKSVEITEENLPEHLRPISPWAYFGLQLLYAVPIVGFIFLIIFSFKKSNINRRNFTRSYWCAYIILGIIAVIALVLVLIFGAGANAASLSL